MFLLGALAGCGGLLASYALLHRVFRWWIWAPVGILMAAMYAIAAHNCYELVHTWWTTPHGPPLQIDNHLRNG